MDAHLEFALLAAMPQEKQPFLDHAEHVGDTRYEAGVEITPISFDGHQGEVLCTGIGPVSAASALSVWLSNHSDPRLVISVGSAGGLHPQVKVGHVVIGEHYRYADVDARAFGYEFGQVPGQPAEFQGLKVDLSDDYIHTGLLVTASSFISAELAQPIRKEFPGALAVDMESVALAQVCHRYSVRTFISVRGISDLCTPIAGEEFHDGLGLAAERSREVTHKILGQILN